jgi:hypothetical protein
MLKDVVKLLAYDIMDSGTPIKDVKSSLELSWGTGYHPSEFAVDGSRVSIHGILRLPQASTEDGELRDVPSIAAPNRTSTGTNCEAVSAPAYSRLKTFEVVLTYWSSRVLLVGCIAELMIRSEAWPPNGERDQIVMSSRPRMLKDLVWICVRTVCTIVILPRSRSSVPILPPLSSFQNAIDLRALPMIAAKRIG